MALLDDIIRFLEGTFRQQIVGEGVRVVDPQARARRDIPFIREGTPLDLVIDFLEGEGVRLDEEPSREELREGLQRGLERGAFTEKDLRDIQREMPVDYSEWISIAFEVAREKGANFDTTQREIERGNAPTATAIRTFASIWNDRKAEIAESRSTARRVAREEITVS